METLIFSCILRLGPFLGFRHLNFSILGVFRKEYFLGYDEIVDIFFGSSQLVFFFFFFFFFLGGGGRGSFNYIYTF